MGEKASEDFHRAYEAIYKIISELSKVVRGKLEELKIIVATIVAGGHVLIEGPPGSAKTLVAYGLSRIIGGKFKRVQGNPDLLPTDLTGYHIYGFDGTTRFVEGPVFANILMFDELNRTPPRSQSALLQAMAEYQVSIDGITYDIPRPFHVIATEIPTEEEIGIYLLTLTLRDRFWTKIISGYVEPKDEFDIVKNSDTLYDLGRVGFEEIIGLEEFKWLQKFIDDGVYVDDRIVKYIVDLVNYIRNDERVALGPSHRGSIFLYRVAKSIALINKRDYVIPDDIKYVAKHVLAHRIAIRQQYEAEGYNSLKIVEEALNKVPVPKD